MSFPDLQEDAMNANTSARIKSRFIKSPFSAFLLVPFLLKLKDWNLPYIARA
jgi:hypothetical protein